MKEKLCARCRQVKPACDFYRDKKAKSGLHSWCKACVLERQKDYYARNRETISKRNHAYYIRNRKRILEQAKKYREEHPEEIVRRRKEYTARPEIKEYRKKYRRQHRDRRRKKFREWVDNHKEHRNAWFREYWRDPERKARRNFMRKLRYYGSATDILFEDWLELCAKYDNCCLACGEEKKLTLDHIIPLSRGGVNHISNIQPLCKSCNSRKWTRIIDYRPDAWWSDFT